MSKQSAYFQLPDMAGTPDSKQIKAGLDRLPGVLSVSIRAGTRRVAVDYDSTGTSREAIREEFSRMGYPVQLLKTQDHTM